MKRISIPKKSTFLLFAVLLVFLSFCFPSCSTDEVNSDVDENSACTDGSNLVIIEKEGLINVEFEKAQFSDDWKLKSDGDNFSGKGYMVWEGAQYLGNPGNGVASFTLKIQNTGTYEFVWKSAVKKGTNGTEHNDTWLRFADADNFFAKKGASVVYPKDSGKSPNPEGASKDGWFKVFRGGSNLDFKWQSLTYDNNGHAIFVTFDTPGTYVMEVSARSSNHAIDQFVLFTDSYSLSEATSNTALSVIACE